MTISEMLQEAEIKCERAGKEIHPARLLLMDVLKIESFELFAMLDKTVEKAIEENYFNLLSQYVDEGIPIQYIIGYEYFAGRNLYVDNGALIPRPETEELVYEVLFLMDKYFPESDYPKIKAADIGTGSGAIAVSLAAEEPRLEMIATDISEEALAVAKKNAASFAPAITFMTGDMLEPLMTNNLQLDVLISNPPYIPEEEVIQNIVKENEPHVALFGGNDGLFFYRKILSYASEVVKGRSLLAFEIGFDQAERLVKVAQTYFPTAKVYVKKDMQGKDRMLFIENQLD